MDVEVGVTAAQRLRRALATGGIFALALLGACAPDEPRPKTTARSADAPSAPGSFEGVAALPARALPAAGLLDTTPPTLRLVASHGASTAPNAAILLEADEPLHERAHELVRVIVRSGGRAVPHDVELAAERWLVITPRGSWTGGAAHELLAESVLDRNGNALARFESRFEAGRFEDLAAPRVDARLLDLEPEQAREVLVASRGLSITLRSDEVLHPKLSTVRILAPVSFEGRRRAARSALPPFWAGPAEALRYEPSSELELPRGRVRFELDLFDLAGNAVARLELSARVARLDPQMRPFARRDVIHVDFASDRWPLGSADGLSDWHQDLLRFGLLAEGDPLGLSAAVAEELAERALEHARALLGAAPRERLELRLEAPPVGTPARLCVGGGDPSLPRRQLRGASSGLLGRAPFDRRNATHEEQSCRLAPALGVFPGELFHAEARAALEARARGATAFDQIFSALAPELGGTPFGAHPLDARLVDPHFTLASATPAEAARAAALERASVALTNVVGALVAHELAHTLGLVEPEDPPRGLRGSRGYHGDESELMSGALDFARLVDPQLELGALERAFLAERLVLR
ncbi:MAG: hypothetical protein IPN34_04190 [Planctomycetes bacterium]|nr:hypothetical protein [Planctomycetota bacterium]